MEFYKRVIVTIILISIVICFAFIWGYLFSKLEKNYIKMISTKKGKSLIVGTTIIVQLIIVLAISFLYKYDFIDTLFVVSFLLIGITWIYNYFRNYSLNQQEVLDKYYGGVQYNVTVFKVRLSPFYIGIYSFCILGILISFLYYLPYFL